MFRKCVLTAALAVALTGCAGLNAERDRAAAQYVSELQAGIQTASQNALEAEDEANRDYWLREYDLLLGELAAYRDAKEARRAALLQYLGRVNARRKNCVSRIDGGTVHTQCY